MINLNPTLTQAGLALFTGQQPGFSVVITHVAFGAQKYDPSGFEDALHAEVARFPIDGSAKISPSSIQVGVLMTALDPNGRSPDNKWIGEIGFYAGNTLFAVLSHAAAYLFYKSPDIPIPVTYVLDFSALPPGSITVDNTQLSADINLASSYAQTAAKTALDVQKYITSSYYGAFAVAPTARVDGTSRQKGDRYFDTAANAEKTWNGAAWYVPNIDTAALAMAGGASKIGTQLAASGAALIDLETLLNLRAVTPKQFGAVGDGVADDTTALVKMFSSGSKAFDLLNKRYKISMTEGSPLISMVGAENIRIFGDGAVIYDPHVYTNSVVLTPVFLFDACKKVKVLGVDYEGVPLAAPLNAANGIGYQGATLVRLINGCDDIEVESSPKYLRYGVLSGDYSTPALGYNKKIRTRLKTLQCGYPIAHYLAEDVDADIYAEGSHRTAYLAGVKGFQLNARFKDQYIAPVQVLITDAMTGNGTSRGASAGRVYARDMGSTQWTANSHCVGISLSRVDPGTTFEDIDVHVHVVASDTVAATLGGFTINSGVNFIQPSYPFNWEQSIVLKNIRVSGVVDRSAQTVVTHGIGELYINTLDSGAHYATVSGLDLSGLQIINGSGANPRALYCLVPGLIDRANVSGCNFGNYTLAFSSNPTAPINFINCAPITRSNSNSGDLGAVNFVNTHVTAIGQPLTNTTFNNSNYMGAGVQFRTIIKDIVLNGASVSSVGAIPPGAMLLGVEGKVTSAITGSSGFQVGVAGDPARFADSVATASGSAFTPQQSAATEVGARYYRAYTDIVVTAKGADFAGGSIRVALQYLQFNPPT